MTDLIVRDEVSNYSHIQRIKKIIDLEERIKKERERYWDCDRNICTNNDYNAIQCEDCVIFKHNKKIDKKIKKLQIKRG